MRWRKQKREHGLASVCQGKRGFELWHDKVKIASLAPWYEGLSREETGLWYWYARLDDNEGLGFSIQLMNTARKPVGFEEAKSECEKYVRSFFDKYKKEQKKSKVQKGIENEISN